VKKQVIFGVKPTFNYHTHLHPLGRIQNLIIDFEDHALTKNISLKKRHFERYDFEKEWNNLGYGKIETVDGSIWALADSNLSEYCGLFESDEALVLWFNRAVGPVDGFDWRIVEDFISCHRFDRFPTVPVLSEIPDGYTGAATFRIDCDEAISSGRPLFELFKKHSFPFSLAIKTDQNFTPEALALIEDVVNAGGSILIHSHTHAPEWGEPSNRPGPTSRGDAYYEAFTALETFKANIPSHLNSYAVSPFHQNPRVALPKILRAGIDGFVGGIICNDPEYLMARGGEVPFCDGMISHSEQCMFHGDCIHPNNESLDVYFSAFLSALKSETFFGYLDHPFSNYHYGWKSEESRLDSHQRFLQFMSGFKNILLASTRQTLDFLYDRANSSLKVVNGIPKIRSLKPRRSLFGMKARWKGNSIQL
jgi:hypothetical protein